MVIHIIPIAKFLKRSMHSSRMRTARSLTIACVMGGGGVLCVHAWQRACVVGRGWQRGVQDGDMNGRQGHVWQGVCMAGVCVWW